MTTSPITSNGIRPHQGATKQYSQNTDLADVDAALDYISPDIDREEWVLVIMAIKSALGDAGKVLTGNWSQGSDKYNQVDFEAVWKSINPEGGVTIATLFKMARDNGYMSQRNGQAYQSRPQPPQPVESEAEAAQKRQAARDRAQAYWNKGKPATDHPYTSKKDLKPEKLRALGDVLLIPMYNAAKQLSSVQIIQPGGKKLFLKGCPVSSCYFPIGKPTDDTLVIVEGWATGMSIHMATGLAVAVAFSSGNLPKVARLMRERHPGYQIILAPDNDESRNAINKAERAAGDYGCQVAIPQLPEDSPGTDFNDLHSVAGLDEVHRQIMNCSYTPTIGASTPTDPQVDRPEFPLDALGPVLAEAALAIANTVQAPGHLAGQSILVAAALATQAHANVAIDNRFHPLSLYGLTIGESGERKSGCDHQALKPHRLWERQQQKKAAEELELFRNEIDKWKQDRNLALKKGGRGLGDFRPEPQQPPSGAFISEEPTLEGLQKSFRFGMASQGLFSDEGGQFFGGHAMNPDNALKTMAGLSKFWDGAEIKRTRAGNGESWTGYDRRLSTHLMVQPIVAGTVLSDSMMQEQGILARFLIASGSHLFGQRPYSKPCIEDLEAIDRYQAVITALLAKPWTLDEDGGLKLATIRPTAEAMDLWIAAYNAIEGELVDSGEYQAIRPAASKAAENIARMAGVLATFAGLSEIDSNTMQNAIRLGDYYLEQYRLNTRSGKRYMAKDQSHKLLAWLKSRNARIIDVDTISTNAPKETGAHGSVARTRSMMQRLTDSGSVMCTKLNNRNRPSEWEIQ